VGGGLVPLRRVAQTVPVNFIDPGGTNAFNPDSSSIFCTGVYVDGLYWGCVSGTGNGSGTYGGGGNPCIGGVGFLPSLDPVCYGPTPDPLDPGDGLKRRDPPERAIPIYCEPDVIHAMKTAWGQSQNGKSGVEAGFRVDGSPTTYTVVPTPFTNQQMAQKMTITDSTFAIFHVHPDKGDPRPSDNDKNIGNAHGIEMFTITSRGLFLYDPADNATMRLRDGLDWMKPCDQ
jgi:hypothetical protein